MFIADSGLSFSMPAIVRATRSGGATNLTHAIPVPIGLGGPHFEVLPIGTPDGAAFVPMGLAFGQPPYETDVLYFVDSSSSSSVVRVPVRVPGAPIVLPP